MSDRVTHPLKAWRLTQRVWDEKKRAWRALSIKECAAAVKVTYQAWYGWERWYDEPQGRVPEPGAMAELVRFTKGQVRPDHFYDLPGLRAEIAAAEAGPGESVTEGTP